MLRGIWGGGWRGEKVIATDALSIILRAAVSPRNQTHAPPYGDGTRHGSGARQGSASNPPLKMSKFKRDLKNDTIPNKTTRGKEIADASAGNAGIGNVTAELATFTTANGTLAQAASDLAVAQAAVTKLVTDQTTAEAAWNSAFELYLQRVEGNTKGDKALMSTTTVPTYDPGVSGPAAAIAQVQALSVTIGDTLHTLDLSWNAVRPKPRLYLVFMCEGTYDPTKMLQIGTPSASSFTATGLLPGHTYWFQVCAVSTGNHQGPLSDPATGMAV